MSKLEAVDPTILSDAKAAIVKCMVENKISKPIGGLAMIVILEELKMEGYVFELIKESDFEMSGDIH